MKNYEKMNYYVEEELNNLIWIIIFCRITTLARIAKKCELIQFFKLNQNLIL